MLGNSVSGARCAQEGSQPSRIMMLTWQSMKEELFLVQCVEKRFGAYVGCSGIAINTRKLESECFFLHSLEISWEQWIDKTFYRAPGLHQ